MIAIYFLIYSFPFPLLYIPGVRNWVWEAKKALWGRAVPWIGMHVLHVEAIPRNNGSGDTMFHYVQTLSFLALALFVTALSLVSSRPDRWEIVTRWLRAYVRYALAATMIVYGVLKVFKLQFWDPTFERLLPPVGEMSPMGLMWRFMGASWGYNILMGGAEIVGGILLVARRTSFLGALLLFGVMGNVVALNFFYDVDAKLYSLHLLAMIVWLLSPDLSRLRSLLLPDGESAVGSPPGRTLFRQALPVATVCGVLVFVASSAQSAYQTRRSRYEGVSAFPLYGLWDATEVEMDGASPNSSLSHFASWKRVACDRPQSLTVQFVDGSTQGFDLVARLETGQLTLARRNGEREKTEFVFTRKAPDRLTLAGTMDGHDVKVNLERRDREDIPLLSRRFHWISEQAYNR